MEIIIFSFIEINNYFFENHHLFILLKFTILSYENQNSSFIKIYNFVL